MPEIAGKTNVVYILAGESAMTGSTGAEVMGVDESTYSMLCDMLEITAFGDSSKRRMAGLKDTNMSLSGNYYPGDTNGQDLLVPGDTVYIGIYPQGASAAGKQFKALVENFEISASASGKQTFSATVQGIDEPVALPAQT